MSGRVIAEMLPQTGLNCKKISTRSPAFEFFSDREYIYAHGLWMRLEEQLKNIFFRVAALPGKRHFPGKTFENVSQPKPTKLFSLLDCG